jgi:hypothetical protein
MQQGSNLVTSVRTKQFTEAAGPCLGRAIRASMITSYFYGTALDRPSFRSFTGCYCLSIALSHHKSATGTPYQAGSLASYPPKPSHHFLISPTSRLCPKHTLLPITVSGERDYPLAFRNPFLFFLITAREPWPASL